MARTGSFRERVAFDRLVDADGVTDAYGNSQEAWGDGLSRWADVIERPGREAVESGALVGVTTATVRVRSDSKTRLINEGWRLCMRGQYWDIESAIQVDRKGAVLEFLAQRGTAA